MSDWNSRIFLHLNDENHGEKAKRRKGEKESFVSAPGISRDYLANSGTETAWVSEKMRLQLNAKMFKADFHADAPWHVRDSPRSSGMLPRRI